MLAALIGILLLYVSFCLGGQQQIKMIEEPSNYGMGNNMFANPVETSTLKLRVPPSNFSGPTHLRWLLGKCFTYTTQEYKYELCPFQNVTQYEQSLRWPAYSGVLGVWQEWEISNYTFVAMIMSEGDACSSKIRSAKVYFACANHTKLVNVTEPSPCDYHMYLHTPLVCHPDSMLVYPYLSSELQQEWDVEEGRWLAKHTTEQGYKKYTRAIFEKAGFCMSHSAKEQASELAKEKDEEKKKEKAEQQVQAQDNCSEELKEIKSRVKYLEELLDKNGIAHNNADEHHGMDYDLGHYPHNMDDHYDGF